MHLDANVMRDEAHDPLSVGGHDPAARILEAARQALDPEPAVRVEHHLDDARVFQVAGDRWTERRAQHARAAGEGL
jgi:hypothetical protein